MSGSKRVITSDAIQILPKLSSAISRISPSILSASTSTGIQSPLPLTRQSALLPKSHTSEPNCVMRPILNKRSSSAHRPFLPTIAPSSVPIHTSPSLSIKILFTSLAFNLELLLSNLLSSFNCGFTFTWKAPASRVPIHNSCFLVS